MMEKRLSIKELRQKFIKDKQREVLSNPVKIEDYLEPYLSKAQKQELRVQLEELVAGERDFGRFIESSINLGRLWSERIAPGLAMDQQQEEFTPSPMVLTIVLVAKAIQRRPAIYKSIQREEVTLEPREPNVWQLELDGDENISLPSEIAQRCYGEVEQKIALYLHRVPVVEEGMFEPQLEASPPPTHDALEFQLSFLNGDKRSLEVPVPRRRRSSGWSKRCEPLPVEAFGTDGWEVNLGMRELTTVKKTDIGG